MICKKALHESDKKIDGINDIYPFFCTNNALYPFLSILIHFYSFLFWDHPRARRWTIYKYLRGGEKNESRKYALWDAGVLPLRYKRPESSASFQESQDRALPCQNGQGIAANENLKDVRGSDRGTVVNRSSNMRKNAGGIKCPPVFLWCASDHVINGNALQSADHADHNHNQRGAFLPALF